MFNWGITIKTHCRWKTFNLLELEEEAVIKQYLEIFFENFKKSDIDIVNVGNLFYRKYPDEVLEKDPISITNLKINVDVEINGTTIQEIHFKISL